MVAVRQARKDTYHITVVQEHFRHVVVRHDALHGGTKLDVLTHRLQQRVSKSLPVHRERGELVFGVLRRHQRH